MTRKSFYTVVSACLIIPAFYACNMGESSSSDKHSSENASSEAAVAVKFEDQKADTVYQNYIQLKNALVASDNEAASKTLETLEKSAGQLNKDLAVEVAKFKSMAEIKEKRAAFNSLSDKVLKQLKEYKITAGTIYKQYCPMANDGKGGFWLASESKIQNPYYGDEMMTCGSVEEEIK